MSKSKSKKPVTSENKFSLESLLWKLGRREVSESDVLAILSNLSPEDILNSDPDDSIDEFEIHYVNKLQAMVIELKALVREVRTEAGDMLAMPAPEWEQGVDSRIEELEYKYRI